MENPDRNEKLSNNQIRRLMKYHYITTEEEGGEIFAEEFCTENGVSVIERINVTGWTFGQCLDWLGY